MDDSDEAEQEQPIVRRKASRPYEPLRILPDTDIVEHDEIFEPAAAMIGTLPVAREADLFPELDKGDMTRTRKSKNTKGEKPKRTRKVKMAWEDDDESDDIYEVEEILDQRQLTSGIQYLVKWKGYTEDDNTWEPDHHVRDTAPEALKEFMTKKRSARRRSAK